jgi:hypothetical protein
MWLSVQLVYFVFVSYVNSEDWTGRVFPGKSNESPTKNVSNYLSKDGEWTGPFFPEEPGAERRFNVIFGILQITFIISNFQPSGTDLGSQRTQKKAPLKLPHQFLTI